MRTELFKFRYVYIKSDGKAASGFVWAEDRGKAIGKIRLKDDFRSLNRCWKAEKPVIKW